MPWSSCRRRQINENDYEYSIQHTTICIIQSAVVVLIVFIRTNGTPQGLHPKVKYQYASEPDSTTQAYYSTAFLLRIV